MLNLSLNNQRKVVTVTVELTPTSSNKEKWAEMRMRGLSRKI